MPGFAAQPDRAAQRVEEVVHRVFLLVAGGFDLFLGTGDLYDPVTELPPGAVFAVLELDQMSASRTDPGGKVLLGESCTVAGSSDTLAVDAELVCVGGSSHVTPL